MGFIKFLFEHKSSGKFFSGILHFILLQFRRLYGRVDSRHFGSRSGTRMKSAYPKVLHRVCGVPMAEQVIRVVRQGGFEKCVVITGFKENL